MSIVKKIKEFYKINKNSRPLLFTTPSHGQGEFIPDNAKKILGKNFYKSDFSEIDGFDNLRKPTGVLKDLQNKLSRIYNSKSTFMLTNGSTSGIISAMKAVLKPNDKVLVSRNCHISIYNGLVITNAIPVWFYPKFDEEWGIFEEISPQIIEDALNKDNEIKAVIITSPTYEGIYSDISAISQICKKNNVILIVDEAHGALTKFLHTDTKPAIECGADISVQSLHKTAGAPNPCALLHIGQNSTIDPADIQESLNLINTTSPSYPLLVAIESTIDFLISPKGQNAILKYEQSIYDFKRRLKNEIISHTNNDITKLLIKYKTSSNTQITEILNNEYNVEEEFSNEKSILFITGIGTTKTKLRKLLQALNRINPQRKMPQNITSFYEPKTILSKLTPAEAYTKQKDIIETQNAIGKIAGETIMEYPPGIPILLPGEEILAEHIQFIKQKNIKICI